MNVMKKTYCVVKYKLIIIGDFMISGTVGPYLCPK